MQLTNIFCLPEETMSIVCNSCDRKALGRLTQVAQFFHQFIASDLAIACRECALAKNLFLLDKQVRLISNNIENLLAGRPYEKAYIKKITFTELCGSNFEQLFEDSVDALSDLNEDVLNNERLLAGATTIQAKMIEKAKLRSKGDLYLHPYGCTIMGSQNDLYGRKYGNYGCENEWQVCCNVWIVSNKRDN